MRLAPGAGRSVLQFLAAAAVFGHCHCYHCHAGMVTRCWGLCYRGPLTSHISIGPRGMQQAAAPALRPYLPPAKGKIWGIFCHCQPPKFPSEALAVLVRGAVTRQARISTLFFSVQRPGAQPLAVPPGLPPTDSTAVSPLQISLHWKARLHSARCSGGFCGVTAGCHH